MTTLKVENGRIDITDPCYDRGTWCAKWGFEVKNGTYDISIIKDEGRVMAIRMLLPNEKFVSTWDVGLAGVDAGLCGFFVDKPTFTDKEWHKICDQISKMEDEGKEIFEIESGVCSYSGYGDGEYPISAYYNDEGDVVGVKITFIEGKVD